MTHLRPRSALLGVLLLVLPVAAFAGPGEWTQTYGDGGHSNYQPIPEFPADSAFSPITGLDGAGERGVRGAPVITRGRVITATQDGTADSVSVRSLANGQPIGSPVSVDDNTADNDTFGTVVGFGPVDLPGDRVLAVHNDSGAIEVAVIDETTGARAVESDQFVPGSTGFRTLGAPALSGPLNAAGDHYLAVNGESRIGGTPKLFRVRVTKEGVLVPDATTSVEVPQLTLASAPTFVPIQGLLHIVVGASFIPGSTAVTPGQGTVRSYQADTLAPGPQSGDLGGVAATPSIPAASNGESYGFNTGAPPIYVPVIVSSGSSKTSKVVKLGYSAGTAPLTQPSLTTVAQSSSRIGTSAPALAVAAELDPATGALESGEGAGPIVMATTHRLTAFSADDLTVLGERTFQAGFGFSRNAPAASGQLVFVQSDAALPEAYILPTLVKSSRLTASTDRGTSSFAAPAVAEGAVLFGSNAGLFGFRGTPYAFSVSSSEAAAPTSGTSTMPFTVSLSAPSPDVTTVTVTTEDGTAVAGQDYTEKTETLTFAPNERTKDFDVTIAANAAPEPDETFSVRLSNPKGGATLATAVGTGTIVNATVGFNAGDAVVTEGNEGTVELSFPIVLDEPAGPGGASVTATTAPGTAKAGVDYTSRSARVTIPEGQTSASFDVPVVGDEIDESDENFTVTLSDPSGAALGDAEGTGTIKDDDTAVLSIEEAFLGEPATNGAFILRLSNPSARQVTARLRTVDGGPAGYDSVDGQTAATAGSDYKALDTPITMAAGVRELAVDVEVVDDEIDEDTEIFTGALSEITGAEAGTVEALGVIFDEDEAQLDVADPAAVGEAAGQVVFTVSLTRAVSNPVTVVAETVDGSAKAGEDYTARAGELTFAAGERTATFAVPVADDGTGEAAETFGLRLRDAKGDVAIGRGQATATITDNDGGAASSTNNTGGSRSTARKLPRRVRMSVTPKRDRTRPYRFRVTGRVLLPRGTRAKDACGTRRAVRLLVKDGGRITRFNTRVSLRSNCTFRKTIRFKRSQRFRSKKLVISARFLGNRQLLARSAPRVSVRIR